MTVIEKKNRLKKIIDSLTLNELNEVYAFIEDFTSKDKNQIEIVKKLLDDEKSLFQRLVQ